MGRFMSPDPSGLLAQHPEDPQSWNLYVYARNNPLIYLDPNGLDCIYANDLGTGLDDSAAPIDHNSNSKESGQNGGPWLSVTWMRTGRISNDKNANVPGLACSGGPAKGSDFTWHVKGNLFLTRNQWSSSQRTDDRGHPNGYAWYFDFNEGKPINDPTGWPYPFVGRRALCVRGSGK